MIIYAVQYSTGYDYNEIISYHSSEEEANRAAEEAEKNNQGFGFFVGEIELD